MKYDHGAGRRGPYFEGFYLKHQGLEEDGFAVIPAIHRKRDGTGFASVQIITSRGTEIISFPARDFHARTDAFHVQIGNNIFSGDGVRLDLDAGNVSLRGELRYGPLTPLKSDIMGPFRYVPGMQCSHGVLSMGHRLEGTLEIGGTPVDFSGGTGYIETDRGRSFPRDYLWTQCSWRGKRSNSLMLSIADIPFPGGSFTGCICAVLCGGRAYRLATYRGVSIEHWSPQGAVIRQGKYRLSAELLSSDAHPLRAPVNGGMTRTIHESLFATVRYRFWEGTNLLFDHIDHKASYEYADERSLYVR